MNKFGRLLLVGIVAFSSFNCSALTAEQKAFCAGMGSVFIPGAPDAANIYALTTNLDNKKIDCLDRFKLGSYISSAAAISLYLGIFGKKCCIDKFKELPDWCYVCMSISMGVDLAALYCIRKAAIDLRS